MNTFYKLNWAWKFKTKFGRAAMRSKLHSGAIEIFPIDLETERLYFTVPLALSVIDYCVRILPFEWPGATKDIVNVEMWWGEVIIAIVWGNALAGEFHRSAAAKAWRLYWSDELLDYTKRLRNIDLPQRFIRVTLIFCNVFLVWLMSWTLVMADDVVASSPHSYSPAWSLHQYILDIAPLWWYVLFSAYSIPWITPYLWVENYEDSFQSKMIEESYGSEELALEWYWFLHETSDDSISRYIAMTRGDGKIAYYKPMDDDDYLCDALFDYYGYLDQAEYVYDEIFESERARQWREIDRIMELGSLGLNPSDLKYWMTSKKSKRRKEMEKEKRRAYREKLRLGLETLKKRGIPNAIGRWLQEHVRTWLIARALFNGYKREFSEKIKKIKDKWLEFEKNLDMFSITVYLMAIVGLIFFSYAMYTIIADAIYIENLVYRWRWAHTRWDFFRQQAAVIHYYLGFKPEYTYQFKRIAGKDFNFDDY